MKSKYNPGLVNAGLTAGITRFVIVIVIVISRFYSIPT